MESLDLNTSVMLAPFMLMLLGLAAILWLAMLGGSLKMSLDMTAADEQSYLRCLLMAVLIVFVNIGVTVTLFMTVGPQPWYIIAAYQLMLQVVLLMLLARCNPFSALLASLAHTVFASFGTIIIAIVMAIFCGSAFSGLKERASDFSQERASPTLTSGDGPEVNPFFQ